VHREEDQKEKKYDKDAGEMSFDHVVQFNKFCFFENEMYYIKQLPYLA